MPANENRHPTRHSLERQFVSVLFTLIVAPIIAQGVWCPLAWVLDTHAQALEVTGAALLVTGLGWLVPFVLGQRSKPWHGRAAASGASLVFAAALGSTLLDIITVTVALLVVALSSAAMLAYVIERLPRELDGMASRRKGTTAIVVLLGILSVIQVARISTFMGDHAQTELSLIPTVPFIANHSCFTAYVEAARLTTEKAPNIYDAENWPDLSHSEQSVLNAKPYAPFSLDAFAYPPPFLLLPRLFLALPNFLAQRAAWYCLNGLLLMLGMWTVANAVESKHRSRILLLAPLVLISVPTILSLQIGNVHASVVVLATLAMVAFDAKKPALGGAMLAFAIAAKLSPGLLVIVLLVQRRYREIIWTAAFGLALVLASLLVLGPAPFEAFLTYQLPMLSSGKALGFLAEKNNVAVNLSPFGLPFKLAVLGAPIADPWNVAKYVNQAFTLLIVVITVLAARKSGPPRKQVAIWLSILTLATLRSPFAPLYIAFPIVWLLSLNATEVRSIKGAIVLGLTWIVLALPTPLPLVPLTIFTSFQQIVIMALVLFSIFRKSVPEPAAAAAA